MKKPESYKDIVKITSFRGKYFFLSNFYEVPIVWHGLVWSSSESIYQAMKCKDISERMKFTKLTPSEAKKLGKTIEKRPDWVQVKDKIMLKIVREKFLQHEDLAEQLISTGDAVLIEGNDWGDRYWGVCKGTGENRLGQILIQIRSELKLQRS